MKSGSNYKMSKLLKTYLAFGKTQMPTERYGQVKAAMISAEVAATAPTRRAAKEDSK